MATDAAQAAKHKQRHDFHWRRQSTFAAVHKEAFVVIATRDKQEPRGRDNNFTIKREHEGRQQLARSKKKGANREGNWWWVQNKQ